MSFVSSSPVLCCLPPLVLSLHTYAFFFCPRCAATAPGARLSRWTSWSSGVATVASQPFQVQYPLPCVYTTLVAMMSVSSSGYSPAASAAFFPSSGTCTTRSENPHTFARVGKDSNLPAHLADLNHLLLRWVWYAQVLNSAMEEFVSSSTCFLSGKSRADPALTPPGGFSSVETSGTALSLKLLTCFRCSHAELVAIRVPSSASFCCCLVLPGSP